MGWGLALAGTYALHGDHSRARAYADSARIVAEEQLRAGTERLRLDREITGSSTYQVRS